MQFQPPRAPMVNVRGGPRCIPPPPNTPIVPSPRLGTRDIPGFNQKPSRGVPAPNGIPPRLPLPRFSPPGIKREASLPTQSSSSSNNQSIPHHHRERPKSMTITKSVSFSSSPKTSSSEEVNNITQSISSVSSDNDEIQFSKESFDRIYKENKEMSKKCKDLLKSNKTLKEEVEIFSLRTKKVEDLEKRNKELEMKTGNVENTIDHNNPTEKEIEEKQVEKIRELYKYKNNKKEIHFIPPENKLCKNISGDNSSPLCINFGDEKIYISYYKDNKIVQVNDINNKPISNCVYYSPNSKEILVGSLAEAKLSSNPLNTINYISLLACECSTSTSNDKNFILNSDRIKYKVNVNENNKYVVELQYNNENVELTTLKILTELFKYIKQQSSYSLEIHPIRKCLISLPVYFSESQKSEFVEASKIAGFESIQIFHNPISSIYSYLSSFKSSSSTISHTILVFDLQPSRLELSLITVLNSAISIINSKKYFEINDYLLIQILVGYYKDQYKTKAESELSEEMLVILNKECEKAYNTLKTESSTEIDIDEFRENKIDVKLKRSKLYSLFESFFNDCNNKITEILSEMNLNNEDITNVISIGERTQLPKFNEIFKKSFKNAKVYTPNKNEEIISNGLAHFISEKYYESKDYILPFTPTHDITLSINGNVNQLCNRFRLIKYLIENSIKVFTTENNQCSIPIMLYEDKECIVNEVIDNLTLLEEGEVCINVNYTVDTNGEIKIIAKEDKADKDDE